MPQKCEHPECDQPGNYPLIISEKGGTGTKRLMFCQPHHAEAKEELEKRGGNVVKRMKELFGEKFATATFSNFVIDKEELNDLAAAHHSAVLSDEQIESIAEAKRKVQSFLKKQGDNPKGSIVLFGNEGLGKTHLAAASVRYIIEHGNTAAVWYAQRLMGQIRSRYQSSPSENQQTINEIINQMTDRDVLVLEDIRKSAFHQDIKDYIFQIVNQIYRENSLLILTSNFTISELRSDDRLGAHLVDRLVAPPSCVQHLKGNFSYRQARKAQESQR